MTWGNEEKSIYKGFSAACFTAAAGSLTAGIYKMFVYNNGDTYPYKPHNAYVGGRRLQLHDQRELRDGVFCSDGRFCTDGDRISCVVLSFENERISAEKQFSGKRHKADL